METPIREKIFSPETARAFARECVIEVPGNALARCIDGRYSATECEGAPLARAGADAGYIMAALAAVKKAGMTVAREKIADAVVAAAGGIENIRLHTDSHSAENPEKKNDPIAGCGHCRLGKEMAQRYGLSVDDVQFLESACKNLVAEGARDTILEGSHEEGAVFIVDSSTHSLRAKDKAGRQAFVYNKTLDLSRLAAIAAYLSDDDKKAAESLLRELENTSASQLALTVEALASGLPVYDIKIAQNGTVVFPSAQDIEIKKVA